MKNILFVLISLSMCFAACKKKETINYAEIDEQLIQEYIANNNLSAQSTEQGVYYVIEEEGTGLYPYPVSVVTVHYEGFLLDGTKFDSSLDSGQPLTIKLNELIVGWQIGMSFFREGSKGKLFIPSGYAYGSSSPGNIPPNSVLIFDIRLINVDNGDYTEVDEILIQNHLMDNDLTAQSTNEGIYYIIEEEGTGMQPDSGSVITAHYEGFLLDDTKFDSSYDSGMPFTSSIDDLIEGWQIGIRLFKEGGNGTLIIPSRYAYGSDSPGSIPPNSVLLFNIELLDVQ